MYIVYACDCHLRIKLKKKKKQFRDKCDGKRSVPFIQSKNRVAQQLNPTAKYVNKYRYRETVAAIHTNE